MTDNPIPESKRREIMKEVDTIVLESLIAIQEVRQPIVDNLRKQVLAKMIAQTHLESYLRNLDAMSPEQIIDFLLPPPVEEITDAQD